MVMLVVVLMLMFVLIMLVVMVVMMMLVVRLVRDLLENLRNEVAAAFHGGEQLLAGQVLPRGGDDAGVLIQPRSMATVSSRRFSGHSAVRDSRMAPACAT